MGSTGELPSSLTSFVGRDDEIALLLRLLDGRRVICVTGGGGCGKTRLAVTVARLAAEAFDDVFFVDLSACLDGGAVEAAAVSAVGARAVLDADLVEVIVATFGARRCLMVIDNCEHVIEAAGALVEGLTSASETVVVIATSREPLGVDGEAVVRLAPLALPGPLATPSEITTCASVALFVDRARLALATFEPDGVLDEIAQICRRVDGLPLAIELAAARVGVLSTGDIALGLDRRFQLLAGGARTAVARHRSMRACIDWSIQLLGDDERTVLDRLSVFPSSWTLASARAVVADGALDADAVEDGVLALVHRSLVVISGGTRSRYRLPDSIRDHAAEELQRSGGREAVMARLLDDVRRRCAAARHELEGGNLDVVVGELAADHDQLVAVFDHAASTGDDVVWELYTALAFYWTSTGRFEEAERWYAMCERRPPPSPAIAARAQWAAAYTSVYGGRFDVGVERATASLSSARVAGDDSSIARALEVLGLNSLFSDTAATEEHLRAAFDLAERAGDVWCAVDSAQCLGYMLLGLGRLSEAELWLRRGSGTSNPMLAAWDAAGTALVTMLRGGTDGVDANLSRAAELAGRTGDPNIAGSVLAWRAQRAAWHGAADEWVEPVLSALDRCTRTGAGQAVSILATSALVVLGATGDWEAADAIWGAYAPALTAAMPTELPRLAFAAAANAADRGQYGEAVTRIEVARSMAASLDHELEVAAADTWLAAVALVEGDTARADRLALGAAGVLVRSELAGFQYDLAVVLAAVAASNGRPDDAVTIAGLAAAAIPTMHTAAIATMLGPLLPDGAPGSIVDAGSAPLVEAIRYATRGRARRAPQRFGWRSLTPTERSVVTLACEGLTNAAIGRRLHVGAGTVKTHLSHIYAKLGVANRTELATAAAQRAE